MPVILVLQEFRDFLYRVLYATSQIQTGQNQNAKRVTGEVRPFVVSQGRIPHLPLMNASSTQHGVRFFNMR